MGQLKLLCPGLSGDLGEAAGWLWKGPRGQLSKGTLEDSLETAFSLLPLWPSTDARIQNDGGKRRLPRHAFLELLSAWKGTSSRNVASLTRDA